MGIARLLPLPHTTGCIGCGHANPHGLHLQLFVDAESGVVTADFTPSAHHDGFERVTHGGVLATIIDEAMVWAASWAAGRFCVCGELTVRYRRNAAPGETLHVSAHVESQRPKLIRASARVEGPDGVVAEASGKFVPLPVERHREFFGTVVDEPATRIAAERLRHVVQH